MSKANTYYGTIYEFSVSAKTLQDLADGMGADRGVDVKLPSAMSDHLVTEILTVDEADKIKSDDLNVVKVVDHPSIGKVYGVMLKDVIKYPDPGCNIVDREAVMSQTACWILCQAWYADRCLTNSKTGVTISCDYLSKTLHDAVMSARLSAGSYMNTWGGIDAFTSMGWRVYEVRHGGGFMSVRMGVATEDEVQAFQNREQNTSNVVADHGADNDSDDQAIVNPDDGGGPF